MREVVSELDRLPDRQRTALLLSVFEGLGYDEIATRLDTSPNSVRALLSRARVHLRKAAAALAPLPLLQSLVKKVSAVAGAGGSGQGTVVAGGSVLQAKLVAVAATTVVAGTAAVERANSQGDEPVTAGQPLVPAAVVASTPAAAVPLDVDAMLPHVAPPPPAKDKPEPPPPAAEEPAPVEPAPPVEEPVPPPEPIAEEPPPVTETPVDSPPADEPDAPKDEDEFETDPPPADGNNPGDGEDPPDDGWEPPPEAGYGAP